MTGIELIAKERQEQIEKHGISIEWDIKNNNHCQLAHCAGMLTYNDAEELNAESLDDNNENYDFSHVCPPEWSEEWFNKMMNKSYKERLIIAGALIAAEIDRIQH